MAAGDLPIEDHAATGILRSVALVGRDGSVDWCPRFRYSHGLPQIMPIEGGFLAWAGDESLTHIGLINSAPTSPVPKAGTRRSRIPSVPTSTGSTASTAPDSVPSTPGEAVDTARIESEVSARDPGTGSAPLRTRPPGPAPAVVDREDSPTWMVG